MSDGPDVTMQQSTTGIDLTFEGHTHNGQIAFLDSRFICCAEAYQTMEHALAVVSLIRQTVSLYLQVAAWEIITHGREYLQDQKL